MGIYYKDEDCGCVTAGSTYGPGAWVETFCKRHKDNPKGFWDEQDGKQEGSKLKERTDVDADLCRRLNLTQDRIDVIRRGSKE